MLLTVRAIKTASLLAVGLCCVTASIGTTTITSRSSEHQEEAAPVLDLTAEVPRSEQGYPGIPGMSGGGGGWRPGPTDTVQYRLPLTAEILSASPTERGDFVVQLQVRNTDRVPFDLPRSPNLTAIEKAGNRSRRVFFFTLRLTDGGAPNKENALGLAAAAGSVSTPGSFIALAPNKSARILLLIPSESVRSLFGQESEKLGITIGCEEWRLDDNRFFLSGMSAPLDAVNKIYFALRQGKPTLIKP